MGTFIVLVIIAYIIIFAVNWNTSNNSDHMSSGSIKYSGSTKYNGSNREEVKRTALSKVEKELTQAEEWRRIIDEKPFKEIYVDFLNDIDLLLKRMKSEVENAAYAKKNHTGEYTYYVFIVNELKRLFNSTYSNMLEDKLLHDASYKDIDSIVTKRYGELNHIYNSVNEYFMAF